MSKRKLTAEEKREKLLELFHETSDVFQLKDLERIAPKEKGIVQQSIKVTLQELVDNGHVRSEKIAGSIYYWAFPSEALAGIKRRLAQTEEDINELEKKILLVDREIAAAQKSTQDAAEAAVMVQEIAMLKEQKLRLEQRCNEAAGDIDFIATAEKAKENMKILQAANRWTDNIFNIKSWCKRKFDKEDRELNKAFGIPDDLDYLDE